MEGVVIYVADDGSRAILWCSDNGHLGLLPAEEFPPAEDRPETERGPAAPISVGDLLLFDHDDIGRIRLCSRARVVRGRAMTALPGLLRREMQSKTPGRALHLVETAPKRPQQVETEFTDQRRCV